MDPSTPFSTHMSSSQSKDAKRPWLATEQSTETRAGIADTTSTCNVPTVVGIRVETANCVQPWLPQKKAKLGGDDPPSRNSKEGKGIMGNSVPQKASKWVEFTNAKILQQDQLDFAECIPKIGLQFDTEAAAYEFYNQYGRRNGFGIRREYRNLSKKDGLLTSRKFSCCKEGERAPDKRDSLTKEPRPDTRTGCQARLVISLDRKLGKYVVCDFVAEHNHPLQPLECVHKLRSHCRISKSQASQIEIANNSDLSTKDAHEFMGNHVDGTQNLGFTLSEQKNYLGTRKTQSLRYGEVGALLSYFNKQASENLSFFYEFQLDVEEQITNIFWADAQMIKDYAYFGDVVTFDTAYKRDKDNCPLGLFVGLNNHRQSVVFGATLLYDESTASFQWLFETFLKAMDGVKPKTILTDEAIAIAEAIPSVMPETFHGICSWHIRESALSHVDNLYQSPEFFSRFEACIDVYVDEKELLHEWDSLLRDYQVPDNSWLHTIFNVRHKWAWAYVRRAFTAGMRSTQPSESLNADLQCHLKSDINLQEFLTYFEWVVNGKRADESDTEFETRHKLPKLKMQKAPMLKQVADIYTPPIFEEFQEEYEEYQGTYIKESREGSYLVANVDGSKDQLVTGNISDEIVCCGCGKFESHGILCSHALKVLDVMNIKLVPKRYILKRWTRDARLGTNMAWKEQAIKFDKRAHFTTRYKDLCPQMVMLTSRAAESYETYAFLSRVCEESHKIVEKMLEARPYVDEEFNKCNVSIVIEKDKSDDNV